MGALFFHWLMTVDFKKTLAAPAAACFRRNPLKRSFWRERACCNTVTFQFFAISVLLALPVKLILRLALTIKYVWVTPWFNI